MTTLTGRVTEVRTLQSTQMRLVAGGSDLTMTTIVPAGSLWGEYDTQSKTVDVECPQADYDALKATLSPAPNAVTLCVAIEGSGRFRNVRSFTYTVA
jgi:hypothetical protein